MKINANQMPEKNSRANEKPTSSISEKTAQNQISGENVYKQSFSMYKEKWTGQNGMIHQNKFWIILTIILLFVFLSVNSNANNVKTQLTVQIQRITSEIATLNNVIDEVKADLEEQAKIESVKLNDEEEELARNNAEAQGAHVAYLQNQYRDISVDDPAFSEKMDNTKQELTVCFDDNGKQNGNTVWYPYYDSGIPGEWKFESNASFKGTTAKVLWLCYADDPDNPQDNSLLAYCTATYDAETKLFTNVESRVTVYAETHVGTDETYVDADEKPLTEQLKELADQASGTDQSGTEEPDQDTIDTNNEVSETRESYKDAAANDEIEGEEFDNRYRVGLGEESSGNESSDNSDNTSSDDEVSNDSVDDEVSDDSADNVSDNSDSRSSEE